MNIIVIKKKVEKDITNLPDNVKKVFFLLVEDLKRNGAIRSNWKNYSKLSQNEYHCHLTYRYVACWKTYNDRICIEVYYVGSREKAPY